MLVLFLIFNFFLCKEVTFYFLFLVRIVSFIDLIFFVLFFFITIIFTCLLTRVFYCLAFKAMPVVLEHCFFLRVPFSSQMKILIQME